MCSPARTRATPARRYAPSRARAESRPRGGACSRSARAPGRRRARPAARSQEPRPRERLPLAHVGALETLTDALIPCQVDERETGIGLVPDLRRELMTTLEI